MAGPNLPSSEAQARAQAFYRQGNVLLGAGRLDEAARAYGEALAAWPDHLDAHVNRGTALLELGRPDEALADYDAALKLAPHDAEALFNRANTLMALSRPDDALAGYDQALAIDPVFADALANRASAFLALGRFDAALESCERALAIDPLQADALTNRGSALWEMRRYEAALQSFDAALTVRPGHADGLYNRGNVLHVLKRFDEALASFEAALAVNPAHPHALSGAADCALKLCDGVRWNRYKALLERAIEAGNAVVSPFTLLGYSDDPALQLKCAQRYLADRLLISAPASPLPLAPRTNRKIRIAYLSADFRDHPVGQLMVQVIEQHDRERFEIIGVSFGADDRSETRARTVRALDGFHDVRAMDDAGAAALIRSLDIDIAVDLMGHTQDARPGILARRAAPTQATYLGFPATSGAPFIDHVIGDPIITPASQQEYFSERIMPLPGCYLPPDGDRKVGDLVASRGAEGLPDQGFVFASFNTAWKFSPPVFKIWMRLLAARSGSVLWLQNTGQAAQDNLRAQAAAAGIEPGRLVFTRWLDRREDHLARHALADLFLDTLPYTAHATCADALWAGLPVLTCKGRGFASRVAASVLTAAGLPELVTENLREYEELALALSANASRLAEIKGRLSNPAARAALSDAATFTRGLETAYQDMLGPSRER